MKTNFKKWFISLCSCFVMVGSILPFSGCQNSQADQLELKDKCQIVFDYVGESMIHCYEIVELTTINQNIESDYKFFDVGVIYDVVMYCYYGVEMAVNEFFLGKLNGVDVLYRVTRKQNNHGEPVIKLLECDLTVN